MPLQQFVCLKKKLEKSDGVHQGNSHVSRCAQIVFISRIMLHQTAVCRPLETLYLLIQLDCVHHRHVIQLFFTVLISLN